MTVITTILGRITRVEETDPIGLDGPTELQAMLEAKKWGEGILKYHPKNVWLEGVTDPWADDTETNSSEQVQEPSV